MPDKCEKGQQGATVEATARPTGAMMTAQTGWGQGWWSEVVGCSTFWTWSTQDSCCMRCAEKEKNEQTNNSAMLDLSH